MARGGVFILALMLRHATHAQEMSAPFRVYAEDFEPSAGGFVVSGTAAWRWGVPANSSPEAHSGSRVWATNLSGEYGPNEQSVLMSPSIDLSAFPAGTTFQLRWWQRLATEPDFDLASVEVSRDGGGSWERKYGEVSGPVSPDWALIAIPLDEAWATPAFRFRFRFQSDTSGSASGWMLDNVQVVRVAYEITQATFDAGGGIGAAEDGNLTLVASVEPFAAGSGFGPAGEDSLSLAHGYAGGLETLGLILVPELEAPRFVAIRSLGDGQFQYTLAPVAASAVEGIRIEAAAGILGPWTELNPQPALEFSSQPGAGQAGFTLPATGAQGFYRIVRRP